ncbi:hypothetical protein [Actinomadura mexicana]|uniref:Uncharacterized protein n=1 Tax=Actinomadura mexicana TaxID=134959 RepID=A0A238Z7X7_9ACTN|nr:hypothetical protein [Actinomadura mexicana]SNR79576.1 hypothetical protein SAMN06265355_10742 [Actinomadura mexicana]
MPRSLPPVPEVAELLLALLRAYGLLAVGEETALPIAAAVAHCVTDLLSFVPHRRRCAPPTP